MSRRTTKPNQSSEEVEARHYIGIDNGVSGTIGIISISKVNVKTQFHLTPIFKTQDYTKKKKNINRIHYQNLLQMMYPCVRRLENTFAMIEAPLVNPGKFNATASALRAFEATLIALESLQIGYKTVSAADWRKELLPSGVVGSAEQKKASASVGRKLFPKHRELIEKHGDADGLLIAEYCKKMQR